MVTNSGVATFPQRDMACICVDYTQFRCAVSRAYAEAPLEFLTAENYTKVVHRLHSGSF